jgi:hypothetical protein
MNIAKKIVGGAIVAVLWVALFVGSLAIKLFSRRRRAE